MKKNKVILPLLAFAFAAFAAFMSGRLNARVMVVPHFYYNPQGHCSALPFGTCNNSPFGSICVYNDGTGYSEVYDHQTPAPPHGLRCDVVLRHSLNGGRLN